MFIFNFIACALLVLLPLLHLSIHFARTGRRSLHRKIQLTLTAILLLTIIAFEIEVRTLGWVHLTEQSRYATTWLRPVLAVHLLFAISTFVLWILTVWGAWRKFSNPPRPNLYSSTHRRLGKLTVIGFDGTAITGWIFYWMAFVA